MSWSAAASAQVPADVTAPASVPHVVRFDGLFVPADGLPPTGVETATLTVFGSADGGSPLWEETQLVHVDGTGRYTVLVGATRSEGLSPHVLAGGEPRWLEVRFARGSAGPLTRVRLTSVPYALQAANAETLGGLPASAFLRAETGGATDGTPDVAPDATTRPTPSPLVNTGTANYIGKFTNAIDLTSSALYDSGGRIGIGTTAPLDVLHARFTDPSGAFTGIAVQNLANSAGAYSGMLFYDQFGALSQFQGFNNTTHEYRINNIASGGSINFMVGGTSRFLVASSGNIGIGTAAPGDPIHVAGGFVRSEAGFRVASGNQFAGVSQEVDSLIVNIGANDGRVGPFVSGNFGTSGFFRVDTRFGQNLFQWWSKHSTTGAETLRMALSPTGEFRVPGVRATAAASGPVGVMVDVNGVLGIATSSRRYKENILDMGDSSSGLMRLRPVTFHYRSREGAADTAADRPLEYGLIAEDVAEVYPDVVVRLADGQVETVQYHKINAMLLNEVQKQHHQIEALTARLAALERLLATSPR